MADEAPFLQFVREVDGHPNFFTICAWTKSDLPRHDFALTIHVPFSPAEMGAPAAQRLKHTYKIEDGLEHALKSVGGVHMGHVVTPRSTLVLFRSERPAPAEAEIKTGLLKKEKVSISTREDRDWDWHNSEVRPTLKEVHLSRNMMLHHTLAEQGDNAQAVRPVDFTFCFSDAGRRQAGYAELQSLGYELNSEGMTESDGDYWMSVVADSNVEPDQMAERCVTLTEVAERHGGEFDGWACPVVKG